MLSLVGQGERLWLWVAGTSILRGYAQPIMSYLQMMGESQHWEHLPCSIFLWLGSWTGWLAFQAQAPECLPAEPAAL